MGKGLALSIVLGLGLVVGCGDDDDDDVDVDAAGDIDAPSGMPDATPEPDAPTPDAGPLMTDQCPTSYGPTAVSSTFEVAEGTIGFDLDGDDEVDNQIGSNDTVRGLINTDFTNSLNDGSLRTLAELRDFGGLGADDADLTLVVFGGNDSDAPANPADDFDGDEDYYFQHSWVYSLTCEPRAFAAATYTGGVMAVPETELSFFVSGLGGFLDIYRAQIEATIEADTAGYKTVDGTPALIGGALGSCSLQNGDAALGFNALHALVQFFSMQPDIDLDGDGLETIETDATNGILSCTDGDGTVIDGSTCGCDPRIADGFSIAFATDQVGATILGPDPNE